jgi:hypothetical protein
MGQTVSDSNSWLAFTDDLNWVKYKSQKEEKLLRSMLCQQLLFVETLIIPDSWWLSNFQLRRVLENSDLEGAIREKYLIPARSNKFAATGLSGRFEQQMSLPEKERMANLITDQSHRQFLKKVDLQGGFVLYDDSLLGQFFSNIVRFVSQSPESLEPFGLAHLQHSIEALVVEKTKLHNNLTATHLFDLFKRDKSLQDRAMAMCRPIYLINAPATYGYHIALAGDKEDKLYRSILRLFSGLSIAAAPQHLFSEIAAGSISIPLQIDDPVFREAGFLTFDEIASARTLHFGKFKDSFVGYCRGEIGEAVLEDAYKSYQSNLRDYLTKRNAKFDIFVSRRIRDIAALIDYGSKGAAGVVAYVAANGGFVDWQPVVIGASVAVIAHFVQSILKQNATSKETDAISKGKTKLLTRLDVWMGNKRAIKDGHVQ